ncbi:lysozyme C, milk isozyme [Cololabis saira]|uniref:lysozyme C, milk isozyme n=1 Tax=Cololabis saira TaxID=129043 RepID=UPI002AD1D61C|nr:lysozyme C, milk isozyme [Cololabis saira]
MKVFVLLVLGVMGCSLAGARIVSKCELREKLMLAVASLPEKEKHSGLSGENFIAKIVCYVELASDFNTSAVNQLTRDMGDHHSREKRETSSGGLFSLAKEVGQLSTEKPVTRVRGRAHLQYSSEEKDEGWTLYGLFQLCSQVVCSDGTTPSPNICGVDCFSLTDDNITDDISCVLKILKDLVENGFMAPHWKELKTIIRFILQEDCRNMQAAEYFAECF